uniref:Uncharacterized protein n=1 Tax=Arundo donax TaxID=35708 RepID=A0A0A9DKC7_ARUDO
MMLLILLMISITRFMIPSNMQQRNTSSTQQRNILQS